MKNISCVMFIVFLVLGISIVHAQDVNAVTNVEVDNQEIVDDEGYDIDDKEYYGSEGNAEIENMQLDEQVSDVLENEMPEESPMDESEGNGTN